MSVKSISRWLKTTIIMMGIGCLIVHSMLSILFLVSEADGMDTMCCPWLIYIWSTAIPMAVALFFSWKTAVNIGKDNAFSLENARNLHIIGLSSMADVFVVLIGNIILLALNVSHPIIFLVCLFIDLIGIVLFVCAESLSQLIKRAKTLQDNSDLTI